MIQNSKTGGPAFPNLGLEWDGMSLRDYFAIEALPPLIIALEGKAGPISAAIMVAAREVLAEEAYAMADAMIREGQKEPK